MEEDSLTHIKLLLIICRSFGHTYISSKKSESIKSKIIYFIIRLIILTIYIISSYNHIVTLNTRTETQIPKIGDLAEVTADVTCFILKWILYYINRRKMENIIAEVITVNM